MAKYILSLFQHNASYVLSNCMNHYVLVVLLYFRIKSYHLNVGGHTIGNSRCKSFRKRLYNHSGNSDRDQTLNQNYASMLQQGCPISGDDQNLFALDYMTPNKFDNYYFKNLMTFKGLLSSDEILYTKSRDSMELVKLYGANEELFFEQYAKSMVKMGNISPLTGRNGEIRRICRRVNH